MANYVTGSFTDTKNLLDLLGTFLSSDAGWTADQTPTAQGLGKKAAYRKVGVSGTLRVNLRAYYGEIRYTATDNGTSGTDNALSPTQAGQTDAHSLCMNMSTAAYAGGTQWEVQSGAPVTASPATYTARRLSVEMRSVNVGGTAGVNMAGTYHFIWQGSPETVWVFVEMTSGNFQFLNFGELVKDGAYTGGDYFTGSLCSGKSNSAVLTDQKQAFWQGVSAVSESHNTFARADADAGTAWLGYDGTNGACLTGRSVACPIGRNAGAGQGVPSLVSYYASTTNKSGVLYYSKSQVSSQQTLLPMFLFAKRTGAPTYYSPIGRVPYAYYCKMDNYDNAQTITVGAVTYRVFVFKVKGDATQDNDGIAIQVS